MEIRGRSLSLSFIQGIQRSFFKEHAVEPQYDKWVKKVAKFVRPNEVLSYQGSFSENSLLYQGLCYIKVLCIDRGSAVVLNWNFFKKNAKNVIFR